MYGNTFSRNTRYGFDAVVTFWQSREGTGMTTFSCEACSARSNRCVRLMASKNALYARSPLLSCRSSFATMTST